MPEHISFPVFATITLGRLKKGYLYHEALRHMNVLFGNSAEEILPKVTCSETRRDVDLVVVTPANVGLNVSDHCDRFLAVAAEAGLELCPAEVGPSLLISQQPDAWLHVAMEPIANHLGLPVRFELGLMWGRKCISTENRSFVGADDRWVFVQPRA